VKNLVEFIGKSLASHPEEVMVDVREKGRELVYTLYVAPDDMDASLARAGVLPTQSAPL